MTAERPVPPGWTSRPQLYPVGGAPGGDAAILRDTLQRIATAIDGLDSAHPSAAAQRAYEAFVLAHDADPWRRGGADQLSSCALVALAILECLGAASPVLGVPYQPRMGRAVADVVQVGRELGAWVDTTLPGASLPTGPFVALVGNNGSEGLEHVFVALDGLDDDGECPVVEGGQASQYAAGYRVARGFYEIERRDDVSAWARRFSPSPGKPRRLRGYIDLEACLFTQRATVPEESGPEAALFR